MPALKDTLDRLGLGQYHRTLLDNGFDGWETVCDITEDDLEYLGFKLGHRRLLQREIANSRGFPLAHLLDRDGGGGSANGIQTPATSSSDSTPSAHTSAPRAKRRYRRHPRPDQNAPKKPKTAYVNFADHLRTDPGISSLSFVEIAREVGRRWQQLPPEEKHEWECQAARAMQEYEAQMDDYRKTENYRKYQLYLAEFKKKHALPKSIKPATASPGGSSERQRSNSHDLMETQSHSDRSVSREPLPFGDSDRCRTAVTLAVSELSALRRDIVERGTVPYDAQSLPPEEFTRHAVSAFLDGTGSLFFIMCEDEADELLERVYRRDPEPDALSLAELYTIAAVGGHYDTDFTPDGVRNAFYAFGAALFNEQLANVDHFRAMRLLLALALYSILEKNLSSRYLLAAGLEIGRWKLLQLHGNSPPSPAVERWKRVFRTLVFVDCWLSYTLGYPSGVTAEDIGISCTPSYQPTSPTDAIHWHVCQIGLVAAEIFKTYSSSHGVNSASVKRLTERLDAWRHNLPELLQLATLNGDKVVDLTFSQRRAILMVHILYLGAVILLYRQLLVRTAKSQDAPMYDLDLSYEEIRNYRQQCVLAAQQIARILGLISFCGAMTKRCWLMIYWSFSACSVLLFGASQGLLDPAQNGVDTDLEFAKSCLDILAPCSEWEPVAAKYIRILTPHYELLRKARRRNSAKPKSSIYSILEPINSNEMNSIPLSTQDRADITPVVDKLSSLLLDPFGRDQPASEGGSRRILSLDGDCSVFWWN